MDGQAELNSKPKPEEEAEGALVTAKGAVNAQGEEPQPSTEEDPSLAKKKGDARFIEPTKQLGREEVKPQVESGNYEAKTQPKLTDLDRPFWLAPMPLYVSQLRARLNFGSASIRLHLHGSGSFLMSSVTTPNRYGSRKRPLEVMVNFTRTASSDGRMRLAGGI
jgi:hypothetical protein